MVSPAFGASVGNVPAVRRKECHGLLAGMCFYVWKRCPWPFYCLGAGESIVSGSAVHAFHCVRNVQGMVCPGRMLSASHVFPRLLKKRSCSLFFIFGLHYLCTRLIINYFRNMNNMRKLLLSAVVVALMATAGNHGLQVSMTGRTAQDTVVTKTDSTTQPKDTMAAKKDSVGTKKETKKNAYEELIRKGGTTLNGLFTVRHIEDKWYFEVPDSLLGRYLLAVTRYTSVPQGFGKFSGEQANEITFYFEKRDAKTMLMRAYVLSQLADSTDNISRTLRASTTDPIVGVFKIVEGNADKHMSLIEVTSVFKNDNDLVGISRNTSKTMKLGGQQADRTFVDTMKVFPINIEVATTRTYMAPEAKNRAAYASGTITLGLNTSIVLLPKEPMRKRLWDKRVGYFVNDFTLFSDEQHKTRHEQFIARYRLVPKDVKRYLRGELVEPVKPIVYYIDPATPRKWVPYLIQGINDWNKAFEAAGFKNAIQGREWPDDPDMSVDDARYCVLRYLPAEIENAYGPHVSDPRSGEIMESHICWYHNVMNLLTKWYMIQCGTTDKRAQTMRFDEKLMGQLIRFVSSHEVGHTLGLRHNMGASFATPVEKLRDRQWVEAHGHTASIMDYARFNYVAQPEDGISAKGLFPRINDYDLWAIKWGYQYRPEFKDEYEEKEKLMSETTEMLKHNPRLWYSGGEGNGIDPRSQTEDLGDNNMKANDYGIRNLKRIMEQLPKWTSQPNGQYDDLKEMYWTLRNQFALYTNHVVRNIGGRYENNLPGNAPFMTEPKERQQEAVDFLDRHIFTAPTWIVPESILSITGENAMDFLNNMQNNVLGNIFNAGKLSAIDKCSASDKSAYRLEEYLKDLGHAIWKPLDGSEQDAYRRNVERQYLSLLANMVNPNGKPASGDVVLCLMQQLEEIEQFASQEARTAVGINKLHYEDLIGQIKLIRDAHTTFK